MSYRILLMTPDEPEGAAMERVLAAEGFDVRMVSTFGEAVEILTADPPDLLIPALRLGPYNGCHLVLRARALEPDFPTVVVGSAEDHSADVNALGIRMLHVPVPGEALVAAAAESLSGRPVRDHRPQRRWPRKRAAIPVMLPNGTARVINVCYGGLSFEWAGAPDPHIGEPLRVEFSTLGFGITGVPRWSRHIDETDRWAAGVELQPGFADAEAATRWRGFVDSLN